MNPQDNSPNQQPQIPNMPSVLQVPQQNQNFGPAPPINSGMNPNPQYSAAHASQYDKWTIIALLSVPLLGFLPGLVIVGIYFIVKGMSEHKKKYTISGISMLVAAVLITAAYIWFSTWLDDQKKTIDTAHADYQTQGQINGNSVQNTPPIQEN